MKFYFVISTLRDMRFLFRVTLINVLTRICVSSALTSSLSKRQRKDRRRRKTVKINIERSVIWVLAPFSLRVRPSLRGWKWLTGGVFFHRCLSNFSSSYRPSIGSNLKQRKPFLDIIFRLKVSPELERPNIWPSSLDVNNAWNLHMSNRLWRTLVMSELRLKNLLLCRLYMNITTKHFFIN